MTDHFSTVLSCAAICGFLFTASAASAYETWEQKPFSYIAVDQKISSVLKEFSYINDVSVVVSDKVRGQVHGRWMNISSRDFLQTMSRLYDFDWYDDGAALYISSKSERSAQIIPLHSHTFTQLKVALQKMRLLDTRFDLSTGPANDTIMVAGPPRFIALVQQTLLSLPAEAPPPRRTGGSARHLTVFRGSTVSDIIVH